MQKAGTVGGGLTAGLVGLSLPSGVAADRNIGSDSLLANPGTSPSKLVIL